MSASLEAMTRVHAPEPNDVERDQIVVMREVTWGLYQSLLDARGEKPRPRLAYLDGEVEIMTTSRRHELTKKKLARLLEAFVDARELSLNGVGNATCTKQIEEAGLEPDESYFVGPMKEFPDLAIEIVLTSGGIDKLEVYRRLRVAEVWFWVDDTISVYRLIRNHYRKSDVSLLIPNIDLVEVARIINEMDDSKQTETVRAYRESLLPPSKRR
jgi:Uma2 family endonuclease